MGSETIDRDILKILKQSPQPISTREISLKMGRTWHTVDRHCLKLQLAGKLNGFKISNLNVWQLKQSKEGKT